MRRLIKNRLGRLWRDHKGFTLIEMLVVVGIIVALAAVIVPTVIKFTGEGGKGQAAAELSTLQTAMDAVIGAKVLSEVIAVTGAGTALTNVSATDVDPTSATANLGDWLSGGGAVLNYWYCWKSDGKVTQVNTNGTPTPRDVAGPHACP